MLGKGVFGKDMLGTRASAQGARSPLCQKEPNSCRVAKFFGKIDGEAPGRREEMLI